MGCGPSKSKGGDKQTQNKKDEKDLITYNNFIKKNDNDPRQDYRFGKRLGEGTYGMVFKVQHIQTKETRAMKKIPISGLSTTEQKLRLVNDIEILKDLNHPNIIQVYEFYQDSESFYVCTEYCRGGELFSRIADDNIELSESEAANVIKQCLEVLNYCKKQKIAHRDLKPDNIMIDTPDINNGNYAVKIIDWGCSKKYSTNPIMNELVGTPYYIAPEVINKKYTYKCDIWSLGVILFALLCGEPCFNGNSVEEVMEKIKIGKFKFEQPIWAKISDDAKDLITKMLTHKPEKRIEPEEALQHPWLRNAPQNKIDTELMKETRNKMSKFRCQNQLGYAVLSYISSQLIAKDEKQNIITAFKELDKNGDGTLTKDEILEYYKKTMTDEAAEHEVDQLMKRADQNQNDQINYEEFVVAVMDEKQLQNEQKIRQAFKYFDQDGNGTITAEELKNVLGSPGMDRQQIEYWQQIINQSDKNGDQKINFEEFKQMIILQTVDEKNKK